MHMSDALLNPAVGLAFWGVSGGLIALSAKKIRDDNDTFKTPLMAVTGAFIFAAQMINFTIPGTGSSGHLGGGLLLAALLGPYRAFLTLASVLTVQCLFFADGGLLALGCNIFNLAFFPAFIAYPLIFKPLAGNMESSGRLALASLIAGVAGLLMGSFSVVLQTVFSGITELPFGTFAFVMLPIHFAIGLVEGLVVFGVLSFVRNTQPALLAPAAVRTSQGRGIAVAFLVAAIAVGGVVSWFASSHPDGLEWSIARVTGKEEVEGKPGGLKSTLQGIQEKLAFLPDYSFKALKKAEATAAQENSGSRSPVSAGASVAGLVGALMVLVLAGGAGLVVRCRKPRHGHS
ncbi:MAG: energy-coupling factor ABC transporter permease [Fibrobacterota bacterium]